MTTIRNPFKNDMLRRQFAACLRCYEIKHKDLITKNGNRHLGNGVANYFWRGYDGVIPQSRWNGCRDSPTYAAYRAGELIRKSEGDSPKYPK